MQQFPDAPADDGDIRDAQLDGVTLRFAEPKADRSHPPLARLFNASITDVLMR